MWPNPFSVNINTQLLPWKKGAKIVLPPLEFSKINPKVNNRPRGENSPNLVTLTAIQQSRRIQTIPIFILIYILMDPICRKLTDSALIVYTDNYVRGIRNLHQ
jgi:hypothetical protein